MNNLEQIAAKLAEQEVPYKEGYDLADKCGADRTRKAFAAGILLAAKAYEWVPVIDRLPEFGLPVLVNCRIYGSFIATYERLVEGSDYGNWRHDKALGILPPTHWREIHAPGDKFITWPPLGLALSKLERLKNLTAFKNVLLIIRI